MSPHGVLLVTALLIGLTGKLLFQRSTLRVVAAGAFALPLLTSVYLREAPSYLGLLIMAAIGLAGAAAGAAAGTLLNRRRPR